MAFDFPASPTIGQQYTPTAGTTYTWNGYAWTLSPVGQSGFTIVFRKFVAPIAPATINYVPTPGLLFAMVECVGAGGGGAAGYTLTGSVQGGGGGSGGYSKSLLSAAQIGASQTIVIGAGGRKGDSAIDVNGAPGSATSFGSLVLAFGGQGGFYGQDGATVPRGGAGGVPGTGDVVAAGNGGGWGMYNSGVSSYSMSGNGGPSHFGGGAQSPQLGVTGTPGGNYGAGGSGGNSHGASAWVNGADGSSGICVVTEYVGNQPLAAGAGPAISGVPLAGQQVRWAAGGAIEGVDGGRYLLETLLPVGSNITVNFQQYGSAYEYFEMLVWCLPSITNNYLIGQVSADGGATYISTASSYHLQARFESADGATIGVHAATAGFFQLSNRTLSTYAIHGSFKYYRPWHASSIKMIEGRSASVLASGFTSTYSFGHTQSGTAASITHLLFGWGDGGGFGAGSQVKLYGWR